MLTVLPRAAKLKRAALDLLFPRWCVGCGREGAYICADCQRSLTVISSPVCSRCGRPLAAKTFSPECPGCSGRLIFIDSIRAPFLFEGVMRKAIHDFKYRNLRALGIELAELMHNYFRKNPVPGNVIIPLPLHPRRLRERGYNQSALLARDLGKLNGLPVVEDVLIRNTYTVPQARSSGVDERQRNVTGAFTCSDERLRGTQVILIDDVSTSGATLNACANVLKSAGATEVRGLVLALEQ